METDSIETFLKWFHRRTMKFAVIIFVVCLISAAGGLVVMAFSRDSEQVVLGGIIIAPFLIPLRVFLGPS